MGYTKAVIVDCKKASIRKTPWITWRSEDIVGVRDGPDTKSGEVSRGSYIDVNLDKVCYDWKDRKFYAVRMPRGWIYEGCIRIEGATDDGD